MSDFRIRCGRLPKKSLVPVLVLALSFAGGCNKKAASPETASSTKTNAAPGENAVAKVLPGMQASPLEFTNVMRSFATRGVIREFPAGGQSVVIKHEDIPDFMPKMTMEFDIRDTMNSAASLSATRSLSTSKPPRKKAGSKDCVA